MENILIRLNTPETNQRRGKKIFKPHSMCPKGQACD
jgi:hypothetical protein